MRRRLSPATRLSDFCISMSEKSLSCNFTNNKNTIMPDAATHIAMRVSPHSHHIPIIVAIATASRIHDTVATRRDRREISAADEFCVLV